MKSFQYSPDSKESWGQHVAHLGPVGPRWAPCWPHDPCYQGAYWNWFHWLRIYDKSFTCTIILHNGATNHNSTLVQVMAPHRKQPTTRAPSQYKTIFPGMGIPLLKIRQSRDHLILNMGIPILVRQHLNINTAPRPWFNINMLSYQCRKPHYGDKMVVRSMCLHNRNSYTGETTSLYWISPLNQCWPNS